MDIREALDFLDAHIDMEKGALLNLAPGEQRGPVLAPAVARGAAFEPPSLSRMATLLSYLGDPQLDLDVLHITGTNGKGSTARMASALLQAGGMSVGTYTSPHLERVNERLMTAGRPISDVDLAAEVAIVALAEAAAGEANSWFELVTAAMFRWLSDLAVEAAVIEVGAGGRWDATNTAKGRISVITNVELDHMEWFGHTHEAIAEEKVGIVKDGSIAVVGEGSGPIGDLLEARAQQLGAAKVLRRNRDFACTSNRFALGGRVFGLRTPNAQYDDIFVPIHGSYQGDNAAVALASVEAFLEDTLDADVVQKGFAAVDNPGRMEIMGRKPLVILDGAHNPSGARAAAATLQEEFAAVARWIVVLGLLRGRDPGAMLDPLPADKVAQIIVVAPPSPRAMDPAEIVDAARARNLPVTVAPDVARAIQKSRELAEPADLLLVTGSLYLVGAARPLLRSGP